jgi:hypothetical protein
VKLTEGGRPWPAYVVTVGTQDGQTTVEYEYTADRRFGLRRIPPQIVARRYETTHSEPRDT